MLTELLHLASVQLGSLPSIPKRAADSVPEQSDATQPADAVTENETISGVAASPGELGEATRPRPTTSAPAEVAPGPRLASHPSPSATRSTDEHNVLPMWCAVCWRG